MYTFFIYSYISRLLVPEWVMDPCTSTPFGVAVAEDNSEHSIAHYIITHSRVIVFIPVVEAVMSIFQLLETGDVRKS